ncbi:glycoside hydrolase family 32 protein [Ignavigranum ruoffiae]|uniref:Sucrose-6-phosphate hydrolase n=1 Tax=Ignavigranum ruoffiae TaxID=89093 RepID=A0A1H9F075_9LACT|nr:glycoside hydrolase family 32 protein [Ignavigranum ruoffiae]SEQ30658.1 beta-fructofuranosidase [Ignavigranum ruoffiae]
MQDLNLTDQWRQSYHIMPEQGWLNDPNGLIQFDDYYHIYYQYVPESATGGKTHWGHKRSKDLLHFEDCPIFMSPDFEFDRDGVYSGSAIEYQGKIHYFYTGNVKLKGDYDYIYSGREQNTVHVVSPDGLTIESRSVVIPHQAYPAGFTDHIRDPKVFAHDDRFIMLLGGRRADHHGSILLYQSKNLEDWQYMGEVLTAEDQMGYMWECPDFFSLAQQDILVFSPQGIQEQDYQFNNRHVAGYLIGSMDWQGNKFTPQRAFKEFDRGFDFYAPHTFQDAKGRRILIAWFGLGDIKPEYTNPTIARGWQHCLTMPRELYWSRDNLCQRPLPEYQQLRQKQGQADFTAEQSLSIDLEQAAFELILTWPTSPQSFEIRLRQDTFLTYDEKGILCLKHGPSGYGRNYRLIQLGAINQLQIFSDASSLEIFINDGLYTMSTRIYPQKDQNKISIQSSVDGSIQYWQLGQKEG